MSAKSSSNAYNSPLDGALRDRDRPTHPKLTHRAEAVSFGEGYFSSLLSKPGGQRTSDCMGDYAIEGGAILRAFQALITWDFRFSWYDRLPATEMRTIDKQSQSMQLGAAVGHLR